MDMEALYHSYMVSARKAPKMGMKAYWNQTVAQALAYALGIEEVPPSETEFARLTQFYGKAMMVSSQQELDAFVIQAVRQLVEMGPHTQAPEAPSAEDETQDEPVPSESIAIEALSLSKALKRALSRQDVETVSDLFTKELSLTTRQKNSVKEALGKLMEPKESDAHPVVDMTETEDDD